MDGRTREQDAHGTFATIGLVVIDPADRYLLTDFLTSSGYEVRTGALADLLRASGSEVGLILADAGAARAEARELIGLREQGAAFVPLLILLPAAAEGTPWLQAGFDDVLRMPLQKAELAARLHMHLELRQRMQDVAEHQQAEARLHQDKAELERRIAERTTELRTANVELRRLTQKIVQTQEAEREQLARELHDEIGQALTAVNFNLQAFQHLIVDPTVASRMQDSLNIIESTLQQVRALSLDLHPAILDDLGLVAALQWYVGRQAERTGLTIDLIADAPRIDLSPDLKTTCFRIVQEALTNILRHAKASAVRVELRQRDKELELVIHDNGIGFNVPAARRGAAQGASLGLMGMEERVLLLKGRIKIKSARGAGTEIRARFPLPPADRAKPREMERKGR